MNSGQGWLQHGRGGLGAGATVDSPSVWACSAEVPLVVRRWARVCFLAVACEVALSSVMRARRRTVRSGLVITAVLFVVWVGSAALVLVEVVSGGLTPALLKMSHVPYSANSVNSQLTPVHTVQHQQRPVISVNTTTPSIHTVNSQTPPNPVHTTTPSDTQTVQRNLPPDHQPPPANLTTQQLLHMLQPLLIHQHSTLTTINALLTPHL